MIRYLNDHDPAGKVMEWETMIKSGVSAAILSGFAKAMMKTINDDLVKLMDSKKNPNEDIHRSEENVAKCSIENIVVSVEGNYIAIRHTLLYNRISLGDLQTLKEMGFINRKIRH